MPLCSKCGKGIRFIKRTGAKALMVNDNPVYFIPNEDGIYYVQTNGTMRRGNVASDGIKGFTLHEC